MSENILVIGDKRFSSWSLRPWLVLRQRAIPFREVRIRLRQPETKAEILHWSPGGKVPVLISGPMTVWESLAICETLADREPDGELWPENPAARAMARAISSEMHAGFAALRENLSMDVCEKHPDTPRTPACEADILRITALWRAAREQFGSHGPFLFGRFSVADAMYAPVCTRFDTYGVPLDPVCQAYQETILTLPAMRQWIAEAGEEQTAHAQAG